MKIFRRNQSIQILNNGKVQKAYRMYNKKTEQDSEIKSSINIQIVNPKSFSPGREFQLFNAKQLTGFVLISKLISWSLIPFFFKAGISFTNMDSYGAIFPLSNNSSKS